MGMVAVMVPVGLLGDRVAATGAEQGKGATGDFKDRIKLPRVVYFVLHP
jgi:hypothetical protein